MAPIGALIYFSPNFIFSLLSPKRGNKGASLHTQKRPQKRYKTRGGVKWALVKCGGRRTADSLRRLMIKRFAASKGHWQAGCEEAAWAPKRSQGGAPLRCKFFISLLQPVCRPARKSLSSGWPSFGSTFGSTATGSAAATISHRERQSLCVSLGETRRPVD